MLGFTRVLIVLASILVLGTAAIVSLPAKGSATARHGADWSWTPFRAGGGGYRVPLGWSAVDAFTTSTRHHALTLCEPICPLSTKVVYFHGDADDRELFAMFGAHDEMAVMESSTHRTLDACAAAKGREQGVLRLADGSEALWSTTRVALGPGRANEIVYFVATRERADSTLLISGGARATAFDLQEFLALAAAIDPPERTG